MNTNLNFSVLAATALLMKIQHLKSLSIIEEIQTKSNNNEDDKPNNNNNALTIINNPRQSRQRRGVDYTKIIETYVMLINILSCMKSNEQWIVGDVITSKIPTVSSSLFHRKNEQKEEREREGLFSMGYKVYHTVLKMEDIKQEYNEYCELQDSE